jgi:hypothetical protein
MNMINKEPERHEIEALLPWRGRDAEPPRRRSRRAGARRRPRAAGRYDLVREELTETIHLNETSARRCSHGELFTHRRRGGVVAPPPSRLILAAASQVPGFRSSTAANQRRHVALRLLQGGTGIGRSKARPPLVASAERRPVVRFAPQATATDITNSRCSRRRWSRDR